MDKESFLNFIKKWNIDYPYDKAWRVKYEVPLFSPKHKEMCLIDILMDVEEDKLYKRLREEYQEDLRKKQEQITLSLKDRPYIPGMGNWLSPSEDNMSEEEFDDLFDRIKFD